MNKEFDSISKPLISEKSNIQKKLNKYFFIVNNNRSKKQIKSDIEKLFNVKVKKVNVMFIKPKTKNFKGKKGIISSYRKTIVTLKNKARLEFLKEKK